MEGLLSERESMAFPEAGAMEQTEVNIGSDLKMQVARSFHLRVPCGNLAYDLSSRESSGGGGGKQGVRKRGKERWFRTA